MLAQAGIHHGTKVRTMDSRFHGNDNTFILSFRQGSVQLQLANEMKQSGFFISAASSSFHFYTHPHVNLQSTGRNIHRC